MRATVGGRFYGRANVKTQTPNPKKNKNCATLALKVSSDFRWGSVQLTAHGAWRWVGGLLDCWIGGLAGGHAPLEASYEALSKFGRSCRWQLLTGQRFNLLQVARSSKHQIRDNVKHFLSNLWLKPDVAKTQMQATNNYEIKKLISIFIKLIHWAKVKVYEEKESWKALRRWEGCELNMKRVSEHVRSYMNARNSCKISVDFKQIYN